MAEVKQLDYRRIMKALYKAGEDIKSCVKQPVKAKLDQIRGLAMEHNIRDSYGTKFLPGCCDRVVEKYQSVPLLFDHRDHLEAGVIKVLKSDNKGLAVKGILYDTPIGRDMKRLIDAGVLDSLSFWCTAKVNPDEDGFNDIKEIDTLKEVSLVLWPAGTYTLLSTAKKDKRETSIAAYLKRLDNYWEIKSQLETIEVSTIVHEEWTKVYNKTVKNESHEKTI